MERPDLELYIDTHYDFSEEYCLAEYALALEARIKELEEKREKYFLKWEDFQSRLTALQEAVGTALKVDKLSAFEILANALKQSREGE